MEDRPLTQWPLAPELYEYPVREPRGVAGRWFDAELEAWSGGLMY